MVPLDMQCMACQMGLGKYECLRPTGKRCEKPKELDLFIPEAPAKLEPGNLPETRGRKQKDDTALLDSTSTGRKRAAVLLTALEKCEWAGLRYAGGGEFPIIGCTGNKATNRHHGPDKNTTNNNREHPRNLHSVCAHCHNRWHTLNDETYEEYMEEVEGYPTPHDSETRATLDDLSANEERWVK